MQAVVPAAGEGTRLRPLTEDRPKGLVDVAGQPLLAHVFESLVDLGIEEIVTVVGYRGEDIIEHFGESYRGVPLSYVWQEAPKGVADALLQARDAVDGDVVLYNGDNLFDADLERVLEVHRARNPGATLLVDSVDEEAARRTGVVVRDDDGTVTGFVEKPADPPSNTVLTGFFVLSPAIFDAASHSSPSERGELELADALDVLANEGHAIELVPLEGWRMNVNTPVDLEQADAYLRQ